MDSFKICPMCGEKNPPSVLECDNCGTDLMSVKLTDEASIADKSVTAVDAVPEMVRICDCGAVNEAAMRKCHVCGEDISDIVPVAGCSADGCTYILRSIDGSETIEICCPSEKEIGRGNGVSPYISGKSYVSRVHARLISNSDGLFIQDMGALNGTYINNQRIIKNEIKKLECGDEIGLGGNNGASGRQEQAAYFSVGKK